MRNIVQPILNFSDIRTQYAFKCFLHTTWYVNGGYYKQGHLWFNLLSFEQNDTDISKNNLVGNCNLYVGCIFVYSPPDWDNWWYYTLDYYNNRVGRGPKGYDYIMVKNMFNDDIIKSTHSFGGNGIVCDLGNIIIPKNPMYYTLNNGGFYDMLPEYSNCSSGSALSLYNHINSSGIKIKYPPKNSYIYRFNQCINWNPYNGNMCGWKMVFTFDSSKETDGKYEFSEKEMSWKNTRDNKFEAV